MEKLYAFSDLHLHAPIKPLLFTHAKEEVFVDILRQADGEGASILLAGDVLDLTSMTAPAKGLDVFFKAVGVTPPAESPPSSTKERIRALVAQFPSFFAALQPFAASGRLHVVPGNHDCAVASEEGKEALATALGVPIERLPLATSFRQGGYLFACHGNEFDGSNLTDRGCQNPGSIITSALYQAVVPVLEAWGFSEAGAAVPAVRPEENIVGGLEDLLGADRTRKLLLAFVALLRDSGYFTGFARVQIAIILAVARWLVTPEEIRKALADDTDLKKVTRERAQAILDGTDATAGAPPEVVVMGHTHELDATRRYVNLGSWIDHVRGLGPDDLVLVDRSLPVLRIEGERAALYDCRGHVPGAPLDARDILWSRG